MKSKKSVIVLLILSILIVMSHISKAADDLTKTSLPMSLKDSSAVKILPGNNDSFLVLADTKYAINCFVLGLDGSAELTDSVLKSTDGEILSFTTVATPKKYLLFAVTRSKTSGIVRLVVQSLNSRGKERGKTRTLWKKEMPAASAIVTAGFDNNQIMCAVSISQNSPNTSVDPLSTFLFIKTKQSGKVVGTPHFVSFDTAENYYFVRPGEPKYRGNGWMIPVCLTEYRISLAPSNPSLGSNDFAGNAVEVLDIPDKGMAVRKPALHDDKRPDITYAFAEFFPPGPTPTFAVHYDLLVQMREPAPITSENRTFSTEYRIIPVNQFGDPSPTAYQLPIPSYKPHFRNNKNSDLFKQIDVFSRPFVLDSRAFIQHLRSITLLNRDGEGNVNYLYKGQLNLYEIDPVLKTVKLIDKLNLPKRGATMFVESLQMGNEVFSILGQALFDSSNNEPPIGQFDTWLLRLTLP